MKEPILPHVEACLARWHGALLAISAAMFTLYLPVVTGTYVHHDDWYTFVWDRSSFLGYPTVGYVIRDCGRPLGGCVISLSLWFAETFKDAQAIRLILIVVQSLAATIFFFTTHGLLSRFRTVTRLECLFLTLFIFSLPSFQVNVAYISAGIDILGILFGTLSAAAFVRFAEAEGWRTGPFVAGFFWSALGLLDYPPTTMVVWAFVGLVWSAANAEALCASRRFLVRLSLAPLLPVACYAVYAWVLSDRSTRIRFETRPVEKFFWFFREPLRDVLNLWDLFPARWILPTVACAICAGFLFRFLNDLRECPSRKGGALIVLALRLPTVLSCALLCVLPNLASVPVGDQSHALRSLAPLFCLVSFLLFLSLREGLSVFSFSGGKAPAAVLGLLCAVGFAHAHHNVSNLIVFPSTLEMRFIKSRLQQVDLHQYKRIHILQYSGSYADSFVAPVSRNDEFAIATTGAAQSVCPMVRGIFKELGYPLTRYVDLGWSGMELNEWHVSFGTSEEEARSFPEPTLVIDMRRLRHFY